MRLTLYTLVTGDDKLNYSRNIGILWRLTVWSAHYINGREDERWAKGYGLNRRPSIYDMRRRLL